MSLTQNFKNSAVSILHDVCRDRAGYSRAIVKIFLQLGKVLLYWYMCEVTCITIVLKECHTAKLTPAA